MKPTPFDPQTDLAPVPFSKNVKLRAKELKDKGLIWKPHVGCFVWDEHGIIKVPSPFPGDIYFILNLGHFLKIFDSIENMKDRLVWIPTWHQGRLIARQLGITQDAFMQVFDKHGTEADSELVALYELISNYL
jgi:hypothetical protein